MIFAKKEKKKKEDVIMNTILDPKSTEFQIPKFAYLYTTFCSEFVIVLIDLVFLFNINVTGHQFISLNT